MIKKLDTKISYTEGLFHSNRGDIEGLIKVCNIFTDKINEITVLVNKLEEENEILKDKLNQTI